MAAGDLVVADWTFEIRSTLFGDGTNYGVDIKNIEGLGSKKKTADTELDEADGSYGSPDLEASKIIIIPLKFEGTPTQVGGWAKTWLTTTWAKSDTDIPLYFQYPGFGKFYVNGRPRDLDLNLSLHLFGIITADAYFHALDPTIHYV